MSLTVQSFTPDAFIDHYKGEQNGESNHVGDPFRAFTGFFILKNKKLIITMKDGDRLTGIISNIYMFGDQFTDVKGRKRHMPCTIELSIINGSEEDTIKKTIAFSKGHTFFDIDDRPCDYIDTVKLIEVNP